MLRFEQAVYGSFPFRDMGYAPLASSPGCRPEWLDAFHEACRSIGEKPPHCGELHNMLFCLRIKSRGPWMVVGVSSQGSDDRGRPGALAFHGLFIQAREFRKVGYNPFALSDAIRSDWGPETILEAGTIEVKRPGPLTGGARALAISSALVKRRKVAIESAEPILKLAQQVWQILPVRVRKRCSVATWAFANGPEFNLVATPRIAGWNLEGAYRDPFDEDVSSWKRKWRRLSWLQVGIFVAILASILLIAVWPLWSEFVTTSDEDSIAARQPTTAGGEPLDHVVSFWTQVPPRRVRDPSPPPSRSSYPTEMPDPAELRGVEDQLEKLSRLDLQIPEFVFVGDSGRQRLLVLTNAIGNFRYTGALLSDAEIAAIGRESSVGRSRALAWDQVIRRFVADRWPDSSGRAQGIERGPLRWQLDTLAWSFHLELDSKLTTAEVVDAIADALKLDERVQRNPLDEKYPTLGEYAKFLDRLPVRLPLQ